MAFEDNRAHYNAAENGIANAANKQERFVLEKRPCGKQRPYPASRNQY
jgi:hypothetical protein